MMPIDPKYDGVPSREIEARDKLYGVNTERKKKQRQEKLTESYVPSDAADQYLRSGKVVQFTAEERPVRPA